MRLTLFSRVWLLGLVIVGRTGLMADETADAQAGREAFFEQHVRPVLVAHCLECHGDKKQEAGIRLDAGKFLTRPGDSGPAVTLGKPAESLLMQVVGYAGDIKMPPKGKLSDAEISALQTWIEQGAVYPGSVTESGPELGWAATPEGLRKSRSTHWSYQPIRQAVPPGAAGSEWSRQPMDRFVLQTWETNGLSPSPSVDRRTLLRRATFDLIGLPATNDEVAEFEQDSSPDAYARAIDRLLASPHYGERWGRHWMDVARYADTKGYVFTEERKYPFSYTYRDYVIDAFNRDLPFDQFVREQLAADQFDQNRKSALAAMGFLTVGRRFGNNPHDIIDDRIDVVSRGLLGLTVTCARCHDHKFDAIPTDDYYSLYGIFASSVEPAELPQLGLPDDIAAYQKFEEELQQRKNAAQQFITATEAEVRDTLRSQSGPYLLAVLMPPPENSGEDKKRSDDLKPKMIQRWRNYLEAVTKEPHPVFGPWKNLSQLPVESFVDQAGSLVSQLQDAAEASPRTNAAVKQALQTSQLSTREDVARIYGELLAGVQEEWVKLRDSGATALPDASREELRQVLYAEAGPFALNAEEAKQFFGRDKRNKIRELQKAVDSLQVTSPAAPPRAMVMVDAPQPKPAQVFQRGNPGRPGKEVPRQFLQVLQSEPKPFQQGSGRRELAEAISSPQNPLTARVMANRLWQHHFGSGLVRTPSDFGIRGEPPSHPELLDYLAGSLVDSGWSLKWLHRQLLQSATYQQASDDRADGLQVDPENRWLWKMPRRRLEFEPLRDSLLAVSGELDDRMTGRGVDLFGANYSRRRAVYGFIDRQDLPGTFRVFDFPSPDVSMAMRAETTVPQQLLYGMNSALVIEQARGLAQRIPVTAPDAGPGIERLYQQIFARRPTPDETAAVTAFLQGPAEPSPEGKPAENRWEQVVQALLMSNEFVFVD